MQRSREENNSSTTREMTTNAVSTTTSTQPATMSLWPTTMTESTWSAESILSLSTDHAPVSTTLTAPLLLNISQPSSPLHSVNLHPLQSPLPWLTIFNTPFLFHQTVPDSLYQQVPHCNPSPDHHDPFQRNSLDRNSWPPLQPSDDRHYWVSRLRYTGQGEGKYIRCCFKCNAVWPLGEQLSTTVCKVSRLFQQHEETFFECHKCYSRCNLEDIGTHVASIQHDLRDPDDGVEHYMSYLCMICKTMFYGKWQVFIHHRTRMHYGALATVDKRQPTVTIIMRWLMRDFLASGRKVLMYACMKCKHYGRSTHNRSISCEACKSSDNKFYCKYCNVIFSSQQSGYEIHRYTFEHFYIKTFGWS